MEIPLQVTFRGVPVSDETDSACRKGALLLEHFAGDITRCRVVVTKPQQRRTSGSLYEVRLNITIPGKEIAVTRVAPEHKSNESLESAVQEAFSTARRQLEDAVRKRRGAVKAHESPAQGRVARMLPLERCGFIVTPEGRELYFHANSLQRISFEALEVGDQVEFREEQGELGPQTTWVARVAARPHLAS